MFPISGEEEGAARAPGFMPRGMKSRAQNTIPIVKEYASFDWARGCVPPREYIAGLRKRPQERCYDTGTDYIAAELNQEQRLQSLELRNIFYIKIYAYI